MDTSTQVREILRLINAIKDSDIQNEYNWYHYEIWESLINIKYELIGILEYMGIDREDIE